jgi:hypothetical protein
MISVENTALKVATPAGFLMEEVGRPKSEVDWKDFHDCLTA